MFTQREYKQGLKIKELEEELKKVRQFYEERIKTSDKHWNTIKAMDKAICRLHTHPDMEKRLGIDRYHNIIDSSLLEMLEVVYKCNASSEPCTHKGRCSYLYWFLDTIADRDKQLDDLRAKVRELENRPYRPLPVIEETPMHRKGCNALIPAGVKDGWSCTCGAVKESEVVIPTKAEHKKEDCLCDDCFFRRPK